MNKTAALAEIELALEELKTASWDVEVNETEGAANCLWAAADAVEAAMKHLGLSGVAR
jgi:hypothetical protein